MNIRNAALRLTAVLPLIAPLPALAQTNTAEIKTFGYPYVCKEVWKLSRLNIISAIDRGRLRGMPESSESKRKKIERTMKKRGREIAELQKRIPRDLRKLADILTEEVNQKDPRTRRPNVREAMLETLQHRIKIDYDCIR